MKNFKLNHLLYIVIFGLTASCTQVEANIPFSGGQYVTTWEISDFMTITNNISGSNFWKWLDEQGYNPTDYIKSDVDVFYFEYQTTDPYGDSIKASAQICIPKNATGPLPITLYHHGTAFNPLYNVSLAASTWASSGMIVVAVSYLGYFKSANKAVHPYYISEAYGQLAKDLLAATKSILDQNSIAYTENLLLYGVSEGGYAVTAIAKKFQAESIPVTLVTSCAGPIHVDQMLVGAWTAPPNPFTSAWVSALLSAKVFFAASAYAENTCYPYTTNLCDGQSSFKTKVTTNFKLILKEPFTSAFIDAYLDKENRYEKLYAIEALYDALPEPKDSPLKEVLDENFRAALDADPYNHPFTQFYRSQNVGYWKPEMPFLLCNGTADAEVPYVLSVLAYQIFTLAYQAPDVTLALYPGYDHYTSRFPTQKDTTDKFFDLINTGT